MDNYTNIIEENMDNIDSTSDDFAEKLEEVANTFRSFYEAIDEFIIDRGYKGDSDDIEQKVLFTTTKFKENEVYPIPRNIKSWYTEYKKIERKTGFLICFAFNLNVAESNEFFRKVMLDRCFDCHYIEEAVYYYAISNNLGYKKAKEIIEKLPNDEKSKINFDDEILYTKTIMNEIDSMKNENELIEFFNKNINQFGYNNARAYVYIKELWEEISKCDGIAFKENQKFLDKSIKTDKKRSAFDIYKQILGFDDYQITNINSDRTLKPILKNNKLLHPLAEDSFPERQGLQRILKGEHKSYELVRKTIILLSFYKYWAEKLINEGLVSQSSFIDCDRCIQEINTYLLESCYPTLYIGNPFDWIFMFCCTEGDPLGAFRQIMNEIYMVKEDELANKFLD